MCKLSCFRISSEIWPKCHLPKNASNSLVDVKAAIFQSFYWNVQWFYEWHFTLSSKSFFAIVFRSHRRLAHSPTECLKLCSKKLNFECSSRWGAWGALLENCWRPRSRTYTHYYSFSKVSILLHINVRHESRAAVMHNAFFQIPLRNNKQLLLITSNMTFKWSFLKKSWESIFSDFVKISMTNLRIFKR